MGVASAPFPAASTKSANNMPRQWERKPLTPKQERIWQIIRHTQPGGMALIGYGGAAGGGKTRALVELAIDLAVDYPGNKILIGRKDLKDLKTTTMEQFDMHCPYPLVVQRNNQEHWRKIRLADWPEGVFSLVIFRELKDYLGLGSEEYGAALLDEAGEIPANSARMLLGRLRWQLPEVIRSTPKTADTPWGRNGRDIKYVMACASNPWPGWFEAWFVKREMDETSLQALNTNLHFIPALPADNPHLPVDYEARLRSQWPEDWVKRMMEGRWDAFEGQVYPEFSSDIHLYNRQLPDQKDWKRVIGGLDFGGQNPYDHMSAGIVAVELKSGRIIRVAEFEERGKSVYDRQLAWMLAQEARWCSKYTGMRIWWVADRSQGVAINQWQKMGFKVIPSKGGWDSVEHGIAMVARRLELDDNGLPGSYYASDLTSFPQRMAAYRWAEPPDDDSPVKRQPIKRNDDLMDADRYMHELLDKQYGSPAPGQFPVVDARRVNFQQMEISNREMMGL